MFPSKRFLRMIAYGAPLWLLYALEPTFLFAPLLFLGLMAVLALREVIGTPGRADFEVTRSHPKRFSMDSVQEVTVSVTNHSNRAVRLKAIEDAPEHLELLNDLPEVLIEGGRTVTLTYQVRACKRGKASFGALHVRIYAGMGLIMRQMTLPCDTEVRIYPQFLGVDRYELLAKIDEREEAVKRPRRIRGQGSEFESLRAYIPGEDLRNVDWKASARRGSLISRNLQVERGQQLAVLIDAGRFMNEQIGKFPRFEHALNATVMLSHVVQRRGDSIALSCFSNEVHCFVPPMKGAAIMPTVLESLFQVETKPVESDYWHVTAGVMDQLKRRSLIIMMTDLLDVSGSKGLMRNLFRAARKHLVLCVVFIEKAVYETADSIPDSEHQTYHKAAASHLGVERMIALEQMRARGILVLETSPENLSMALIRQYLEIRQSDLL